MRVYQLSQEILKIVNFTQPQLKIADDLKLSLDNCQLDEKQIDDFIKNWIHDCNLNLLVSLQFQIEILFDSLLKKMGKKEIPNKFYKKTESILKNTLGYDLTRQCTLNFPAHIRNALHNNGIAEVIIQDELKISNKIFCKFRTNKKLETSFSLVRIKFTHADLVFVYMNIFKIVEAIIFHDKIVQWQIGEIQHDFQDDNIKDLDINLERL